MTEEPDFQEFLNELISSKIDASNAEKTTKSRAKNFCIANQIKTVEDVRRLGRYMKKMPNCGDVMYKLLTDCAGFSDEENTTVDGWEQEKRLGRYALIDRIRLLEGILKSTQSLVAEASKEGKCTQELFDNQALIAKSLKE